METIAPESRVEAPLLPEPWIVAEVRRESADVVTLSLEPGPGVAPLSFRPGEFNMLYMFGIGEVPISISGDHADPQRLVHTVRDVGKVTHAICSRKVGDVVGVRGPFGSHWPVEEGKGRDVVVAAGGIGLAPLRPVLYHVARHRGDYDDVVLLYGARTPEELLYIDELETWKEQGVQVEITVDNAGAAWSGHIGVVTTLIRYAQFDAHEALGMLCGPELMMRFTARELLGRGVPPDRTYISMERNMKCAVGFCGHCQLGPEFLCMDGPVFPWPRVRDLMLIPEL